MKKIALYTTIYPGVEAYLPDWYRSVMGQTDSGFALWIGLDTLTIDAAIAAMQGNPSATWVHAAQGDTPAQIRQRALERIVETCYGVVLVDSDDILHPSRVAAARKSLRTSELAGCALSLVDQKGKDLDLYFKLPPEADVREVLPNNNVFGLSNSAFRSDLLRRCLPIPSNVTLVDWYLATRAWLSGAKLNFDNTIRMDYRQHGANTARVTPPFSPQQVKSDCEYVRHHFNVVRATPLEGVLGDRYAALERAASEVEAFYQQVVLQPVQFEKYLQALNNLKFVPIWWSCVANSALRKMWISSKETR